MPNTVKARTGKRGCTGGGASVLLTLSDGSEVDLGEKSTLRDLIASDETREQTVGQLLELREQLDAHLAALRRGNLVQA